MSENAEYFIAQYLADPFRQEPRNVGVLVLKNERVAAKFTGRSDKGEIDGRKLRGFPFPRVYEQWLEYWTETARRGAQAWPTLLEEGSGSHYRLVRGGEVTDTGDDSPQDVAAYLFSTLVSDGGIGEALGRSGEEAVSRPLTETVSAALREVEIIDVCATRELPHPVQRDARIPGKKAGVPHRAEFAQESEVLFVMETVDFRDRRRERLKDRAGWIAYMFNDIRDARGPGKVRSIAIVDSRERGDGNENADYAMSILRSESDEFVDWSSREDRNGFISARREVATRAD